MIHIEHGEKKQLLVLFASPHAQGTTRQLLEAFLQTFRQDPCWEITEMNAFDMQANACIGCKVCAKREGCIYPDLDILDSTLRRSDLLVIASPMYNYSFPAPMKAILDRTQRYYEAWFSLNIKPSIQKPRKAVLLVTMGADEEFGITVMCHQLERAYSVMNTRLAGCAVWRDTDKGTLHKTSAFAKAQALAVQTYAEVSR